MRHKIFKIILAILFALFFCCQIQQTNLLSDAQKLERFFNKKEVTILVTDSGLGGVSVAADVVERLKHSGVFKKAEVVFFNAQPHIKSGYNMQKTTEQKVAIFENVLRAMEEKLKPDLLMIACNTLSVLYPLTDFSKQTEIPVVGVVETGVDLIEQNLREHPESPVIIFATSTTVKQNNHKRMLMERGIPEEKIITQACPRLAGSIERGYQSKETDSLVNKYVSAAIEHLGQVDVPVFISFNCTHYGYISDQFESGFMKRGVPVRALLDPNPQMADFLFTEAYRNRYPQTEVSIRIISQPELPEKRIASISELIGKVSPQTAEALRNYQFTPEFFEWRSLAVPIEED
ncbi:MAG: hypothetical protein Kow0042_03570 [Calditrichia bacterium]